MTKFLTGKCMLKLLACEFMKLAKKF